MHTNDTPTTRQWEADQAKPQTNPMPRTRQSKVTNDPLIRANGRTAAGKRTRDLFRAFVAEAGGPDSDVFQAAALAAAELTVAAEAARAKVLAGQGDVEQLVRLENLASRAIRRLNLKAAPPKGPDLDEYLGSPEHETAAAPQPDTVPAPGEVVTQPAEPDGVEAQREESAA